MFDGVRHIECRCAQLVIPQTQTSPKVAFLPCMYWHSCAPMQMLWPIEMLQMASRSAGCKSLPLQAWVVFEPWLKEDKGLEVVFDLDNKDRAGQKEWGGGGGG